MKNSNDTIGNRTHDLRLVAQCLNQLRHRVLQQDYIQKVSVILRDSLPPMSHKPSGHPT